jgi:hypothetical protein
LGIRPAEQKRLDKGDTKAGSHYNQALNRMDKNMLDIFLRRGSYALGLTHALMEACGEAWREESHPALFYFNLE